MKQNKNIKNTEKKGLTRFLIILFGTVFFVAYIFIHLKGGIFFFIFHYIFGVFNCTKFIQNHLTIAMKTFWLRLTMALFSIFFRNDTYIAFDEKILASKKSIIISNHITNYDWIFVMKMLYHFKKYEDILIVLKYSLKKIPIAGFSMKCFGFIFLKRNWAEDKSRLDNGIQSIETKNFHILIFPEGTILDEVGYKAMLDFIKNKKLGNKIYVPKNTLIPRKHGFDEIYKILKGKIDGIIDITLINQPYKRFSPDYYTLKNVFYQKIGEIKVHMIVDFHEIAAENFLDNQFKKKDFLLQKFTKKEKNIEKLDDYSEFVSSVTNVPYKYIKVRIKSKLGFFFIFSYITLSIYFISFLFYSK